MTPADSLASHRRMIGISGETILVRRYAGTGAGRAPSAEVAVLARVLSYQPHEIVGSVVQGDRRVIALVDALGALLPLTTADKLVIRGREVAIKAVDDNTRRVAGTLIALDLQVQG